jgi:two-component system, chemotaxis family, sensor kinase CheA
LKKGKVKMARMDMHNEMFKAEAYELLAELETSLLELEERPEDNDIIGRVFRAMHTIKGSGAMFGFEDIAAFTHEVETVYDLVRNGKLSVSRELIDLTLQARDIIREMLDASAGDSQVDKDATQMLITSFRQFIPQGKGNAGTASAASSPADKQKKEDSEAEEVVYRIRFKPPQDIFLRGVDPLSMLQELADCGKLAVIAETSGIPYLEEYNADYCYTAWDIVLITTKDIDAIRDTFIFVEEDSEIKIERIEEDGISENSKMLGEILIDRGDLTREALAQVMGGKKLIGTMLVEAGLTEPDKVEAALAEQKLIRDVREKKKAEESVSNIRVASEKLDKLVNLVGEMVTVQANLSQIAGRENNAQLTAVAEEVERLTAELRDTTMNIRMLPIGSTFSKFRRLVRDLSKELGKEIEMETEGAETELDKTVIEKLNDPMVHLIRNCIDHGIEAPDVRESKGKDRKGTVHLSAMHSGANVLIRIKDDGAGLNTEAIRNKAIEKGLITGDTELSDKEIYSLILAPGFSTAKTVTSVSGRGVGMDVVKQAIEALRGTIEIDSIEGEGTIITLKLPLTLAIIDGLLVQVGHDYYVMQLSLVKECVELTARDRAKASGGNLANVRGQLVPYIRLRDQFSFGGELPEIEQIVITEVDEMKVGFVVDLVVGEHQTVIKSLGSMYRNVEGLSGATILGSGTVALILDVPKLIGMASIDEMNVCVQAN